MSTPVMFQALPPLSPEEYKALETSILENGVIVPIAVDENGIVIDGHHRQQIAQHHDLPCPREVHNGFTDSEKRTLALSLNIDRRHLTREQKRALVAESIKADPQLSDREHGRRTGVSKNTAAAVRDSLESTGQVDQSNTRISADGRVRPSSQPARPVAATDESEDDQFDLSDPRNAAAYEAVVDELYDSAQAAYGRETAPGTPPNPAAPPRRKPITDQARDAGWELRKAVERIERIAADDRFSAQIEKMTPQLRGHLTDAITSCQAVLDRINNQ